MKKTIQYITCIFTILFTTNVLALAALKINNQSRGVFAVQNGLATAMPDDGSVYLPVRIMHTNDPDKNLYIYESGMPCIATFPEHDEHDLTHKGWFLYIYKEANAEGLPYRKVCTTLGATDTTTHGLLTLAERYIEISNDGFPYEIRKSGVALLNGAALDYSFSKVALYTG